MLRLRTKRREKIDQKIENDECVEVDVLSLRTMRYNRIKAV
jgi:hypothetical protein